MDNVTINYSIKSHPVIENRTRLIQEIYGSIQLTGNNNPTQQIGTIQADKLLLSGTVDNPDIGPEAVFEQKGYLKLLGNALYDFEVPYWHQYLCAHFKSDIVDDDLLVLKQLHIESQFRKQKIGTLAVKDLYENFISGCGLFTCVANSPFLENGEDRFNELPQSGIPKAFLKGIGFSPLPFSLSWFMAMDPNAQKKPFIKYEE